MAAGEEVTRYAMARLYITLFEMKWKMKGDALLAWRNGRFGRRRISTEPVASGKIRRASFIAAEYGGDTFVSLIDSPELSTPLESTIRKDFSLRLATAVPFGNQYYRWGDDHLLPAIGGPTRLPQTNEHTHL